MEYIKADLLEHSEEQLYFEVGAKEFWICDKDGIMRFFNPRGELAESEFFGEFPKRIDIVV